MTRSLRQTWNSCRSLSWFKHVNVTQPGLAVEKHEPGLHWLKSGSWPQGEVVCLGVAHVSHLLNNPPTSLSEAVYSPGKWTPLRISAAHHAAFVLRQGLRLESLRCHSSQENFYFTEYSKKL